MNRNWNRRDLMRSLSAGAIAGHRVLSTAARATVATPLAQCIMFNYRGEPLSLKEFDRFHTCDLLMRRMA